MRDEQDFTLAAGFGPVEEATWRAQVERELKGAAFDKRLVTRTPEGIALQPLYHAENTAGSIFPASRRGAHAGREGYWELRQPCDLPSPAEANAAVLEDLTRGSDGVLLEVAAPWRARGLALRDLADLDEALRGVWMDQAPLAIDAGARGLEAAAARLALARRRGQRWEALRGDLLLDPVAAAARGEALPGGAAAMMARSVHVAAWCAARAPELRALSVDTAPYDEAGADMAWALGAAMSGGVAWLRALEAEGLPLSLAATQVLFRLRLSPRFLMSIAYLRAARALWARITSASGLESAPMRIEARLSWRVLTRRDPWVNLLRVSAGCFAGSAGGADVFVADPMDAASEGVMAQARRMARNTQIVLQREAGLAQVLDPAGGSWALEAMTAQVAEGAWAVFQRLERGGGVLAALERGELARELEAAWAARSRELARRTAPITGVSAFPALEEAPLALQEPAQAPARPLAAPSAAALAAVASAPREGLLEALIEAADEGAALAALGAALGEAAALPGLPRRREAGAFEALRDKSDAALASQGARPGVFLACLGPLAEHSARQGFVKNLVEAGGLAALGGEPCEGPPEAAARFGASGARIAALCGSDERYLAEAPAFAAALRAAGAAKVVLAGRPPQAEEARWRAAGVTDFVFLGCDALEALEALWAAAEEAR